MSTDVFYSGLALLGAACGLTVAWWRRARCASREREGRKLASLLAELKLLPAEKTLLDELAGLSGEPLERVARLILSFDRGVDRYLAQVSGEPLEARAWRLRRLKSLRQKLGFHGVAAGEIGRAHG